MGLTQVDGGDGLKKPIDLADNEKARFGTGGDLQIFHNGSHNVINGAAGQNLEIQTNAFRVKNQANTEAMIVGQANGAVQLFHDNSEKLITKADGVDITGELQCDSLDVDGSSAFSGNLNLDDNVKLRCGTHGDLDIFHDGSNSVIHENGTGHLLIRGDGSLKVQNAAGSETKANFHSDGAVELYFDSNKKFETKSDGVDITGELQCDSLDVDGSSNFESVATFGGNYTSFNNNGYIRGDDSGVFRLQAGSSNTFRFSNSANSTIFAEITSGSFRPGANNTYDLGTSSLRWRNVYTNDLNLSNEGSANDVDGTWGNYTIQEGEDNLFLINRRNGKKYKFNLTEVN